MKAWLLTAALLSVAPGARAAEPPPPSASIDVVRDGDTADCAEASGLARAVEARLGRRVFGAFGKPDLRVYVRFERVVPKVFRAVLRLTDGAARELGRREISANARHCSALDASLALVIALLVDTAPVAPTASPAGPGATVPTPPRPEAPRPTPITLAPDTDAPREPWWFAVTLSGVAAFGVLPGSAFGGALGLGARPPRFRQIWASAELLPERTRGSAQRTALSLARFGLMLCPLELGTSALQGVACAGQRVGFVDADGSGFDVNQTTRQLSYELALEVAGSWRVLPPLFLRAAAGLEFPLLRPAYVSRPADGTRREWFQASPVAASARAGAGLEF